MYSIVITEWHEKNKNDWCAVRADRFGEDSILYDRDDSLMKLSDRMKARKDIKYSEIVYTKAWTSGISQNHPIWQKPKRK